MKEKPRLMHPTHAKAYIDRMNDKAPSRVRKALVWSPTHMINALYSANCITLPEAERLFEILESDDKESKMLGLKMIREKIEIFNTSKDA